MWPHGLRTCDTLFQTDLELHAQLFTYGLSFRHHVGGQLARGSVKANVFKRRMRQGADGVKAQVAPHLEPDFRAYVHRNRCFEARAFEGITDGANARRVRPVNLAEREAVAFNHLDHTGANHFTGRVHHAPNHAVDRDVLGNHTIRVNRTHWHGGVRARKLVKVPPGNPILHGHHAGRAVHQVR